MIDIKLLRENPQLVQESCKKRGYDIDIDSIVSLDKKWRELKAEDDSLRADRNKISEQINQAKKAKDEKKAKEWIKKAREIPEKLAKNEQEEKELRAKIDLLLASIPNMQKSDVPVGGAEMNFVVHTKGKIPKMKNPKTHLELGKGLDLIDMDRATKISGAGFYILKGKGAKLQRALIQFMLDFHSKNGLVEINPPQLVNRSTAFGTGNLPKFEDQLYRTNDDLILVPTAEVPITNMFSDETLNEKDLPKKFCAFTECYRTEAGKRAGEEGLFRLHQFEKVEMVYLCKSEESWDLLEEMTRYAENILDALELPYRRILLATGDASFASAKTYDLEVWSPAMGRYLETSSCSNCMDFQARRMNTKYQGKNGTNFVHTLNGSGLALPRLMISLIENNQTPEGTIKIPKALWKYTGFKEIKPEKVKGSRSGKQDGKPAGGFQKKTVKKAAKK